MEEEKRTVIRIHDDSYNKDYFLSVTEDQIRMLRWLRDNSCLHADVDWKEDVDLKVEIP